MAKETEFDHPPGGHIAPLVFDSVAKKWYAIKGSGYNYLQVAVVSQPADVEVKQTNPADLCVAQHQYDGSAWRKSNLLFGYSDRYVEQEVNLNAAAGANLLDFTVVPANEIWIVTHFTSWSSGGGLTRIVNYFHDGTTQMWIANKISPASYEVVGGMANLVLKEGDKLQARFYNCTLNDDIYSQAMGYKMKIDM